MNVTEVVVQGGFATLAGVYFSIVNETTMHETPPSGRLYILLGFAAAACLGFLSAYPAPALAQEAATASVGETLDRDSSDDRAESRYSRFYTGAFWEQSVRLGLNRSTNVDYEGWNLDAGLRQSFPFLVGDVRLAYRFDRLSPAEGAGEEFAGDLDQHVLGAHLAVHPLFLLMLGSDWLSYTIASLYGELGAGGQMGVLERFDDGTYETGFGPFVSLGAGIDIPLWNPDAGQAPWINVVYRWHVADFDGDFETYDANMHLFQLGLAWRINGLLF